MGPRGAPHPAAHRVDLWLDVGLEPWRTDGYPADCSDPAVLGYWAEAGWEVQRVREQALAYIQAQPEAVRKEYAAAYRQRVLRAHKRQEI